MALAEQMISYSCFKYPLICFGDHFFSSFSSTKIQRKPLIATFKHCSLALHLSANDLCLAFLASYSPFTLCFCISRLIVFGLRFKNSAMERISVPFLCITSIANLSSKDK